MSTDFEALYREAHERGMADFDRGVSRDDNPYRYDHATSQAERWTEGWDCAAYMNEVKD